MDGNFRDASPQPSSPQAAFASRLNGAQANPAPPATGNEPTAGLMQSTGPMLPQSTPSQAQPMPDNKSLEEMEGRLNRMSQWATDTQKSTAEFKHATGQALGRLEEELGVLAEQIAGLTNSVPDPLMSYRPTIEQLCELFGALATWQVSAPVLAKNHSAEFATKDRETGAEKARVKYDYASPGDVSALARTAGAHGLAHFHAFLPESVRTYLVHGGGGYVFADVPILIRSNPALSPIQQWSAATTAAKRLGILAVLGILPDDTDDAGNPRSGDRSKTRPISPSPTKPRPLPPENVRRVAGPNPAAGANIEQSGGES